MKRISKYFITTTFLLYFISPIQIHSASEPHCYPDSTLHQLAFFKCYQTISKKISLGANINELEYGESPLTTAVRANDIEMVKLLLRLGGKAHYKCNEAPCMSPYIMALTDGRLEMVKLFINQGAPINFLIDTTYGLFECSTLFIAVESGNLELVKYMINQGADIHGFGGESPVLAIRSSAILEYFIKQGYNIFVKYSDDNTTLLHAITTKGIPYDIIDERKKIVDILLNRGFDINQRQNSGQTPLIVASSSNHYEMVKYLTEKGADPLIKDDKGKTALDYAKEKKYQEIVDYLESLNRK